MPENGASSTAPDLRRRTFAAILTHHHRMAAAAQDTPEDDRSRRRKLPVIEGRLNISEGENLRNFIKTVPSGHYHAELTYLVLSAVSLQQIPKDICTLPNLTRLGTPKMAARALIIADCSENKLTTLPPEINKLVSLTHLGASAPRDNAHSMQTFQRTRSLMCRCACSP